MPSRKLKRLDKSKRCIVKRRGRKSMKLAKSKTRKYMTKKRVYTGGMFGWSESEKKKAAEAAKAKAEAAKAEAAKAEAAKAEAAKAEAAKKEAAKNEAEAEAAKEEAAKEEAKEEANAAPRDANKAFKAAKAAKAAAAATAAAATADAAYANAVVEYAKAAWEAAAAAEAISGQPDRGGWYGNTAPVATASGAYHRATAYANWAKQEADKAATAATAAAATADAVEKEYVKNQMSQFSRTTLPFMTFLYADTSVSVPSDSDLQAAYKEDKQLNHYQIASLDEVKMIDLAKYKRYLEVFLTPMFEEFDTKMDKNAMLKRIEETKFKQEEVEFTGFLAAIIAIKKVLVKDRAAALPEALDERAAALPEALFEAFSKLSDPRYVMLIFESIVLQRNGHNQFDDLSYRTLNETNKLVNTPYKEEPEMDNSSINGYNSIYLWTLLSRNYYDFYSVIIDKMFTASEKITFGEFIKRYNAWTLKKSVEAKDEPAYQEAYKFEHEMLDWFKRAAIRNFRLYLRPFEKLGYSWKLKTPIYEEGQRDRDEVIIVRGR